jgi:hypothetical protein
MSESEQDFLERRDGFDERSVPQKEGLSGCAIAGIGCGIVLLLLLVFGGIAAWWIATNARSMGADIASTALKEGLKELDLPVDQQTRINARIDDVAQQFKDEKLTIEEVVQIFEKVSQGPLMPAGTALFVKRVYIRDSGLNDEEKTAAELAIQRFARGAIDGSIPEAEREAVLDTISTKDAQGQRQFKQKLTDDEVRTFIDAARQAADDAGVANEVPEINFADEFDKVVDEALGQTAAAAAESESVKMDAHAEEQGGQPVENDSEEVAVPE